MGPDALSRLLEATADRPTPFLAYDEHTLSGNARSMIEVAGAASVEWYVAVKACYVRPALATVLETGFGAEVVSDMELRIALAAGCPMDRFVLNGMGRPSGAVEEVVAGGGTVVVDTPGDAERLVHAARRASARPRAGVRLRLDRLPFEDPYNDGRSKLGLDLDAPNAPALIASLERCSNLDVDTLQCHVGQGGQSLETMSVVLEAALSLLGRAWERGLLEHVRRLDLGGGFPTRRGEGWWEAPGALEQLVGAAGTSGTGLTLAFEPGRAVFSDAAVLVCSVVDLRRERDRTTVVVDGGTNVLLPLPTAEYALLAPQRRARSALHAIVDGIPNPANVLAVGDLLDTPAVGARIVVGNAGAYTQSLGEFWVYEPCPVLWLGRDGHVRTIVGHEEIAVARARLLGI